MTPDPEEKRARSAAARWGLQLLGILLTTLAAVGAFLPVLPTTPFLLLAAACFARSSPEFQQRLLANRVFGPYLRQWDHDHTIPREAKRKAYGLVVIAFTLSIAVVDITWLRISLAATGLASLFLLAWLPTTPAEAGDSTAETAAAGEEEGEEIVPRENRDGRQPAHKVSFMDQSSQTGRHG